MFVLPFPLLLNGTERIRVLESDYDRCMSGQFQKTGSEEEKRNVGLAKVRNC